MPANLAFSFNCQSLLSVPNIFSLKKDLVTPLMLAVHSPRTAYNTETQTRIVRFLLQSGANVFITDRWGRTAKQLALVTRKQHIADILAEHEQYVEHIGRFTKPALRSPLQALSQEDAVVTLDPSASLGFRDQIEEAEQFQPLQELSESGMRGGDPVDSADVPTVAKGSLPATP
eukprot:m.104983 g.104983  ORF g.104983 m.104983 type:complete len:174 (+) comp51629_c0_seq1:101-622(+)